MGIFTNHRFAFCGSVWQISNSHLQRDRQKKYEIDPNILDTTINNLGIQGWELINVTDITTLSSGAQRSGTTAWIFKKPFGTG